MKKWEMMWSTCHEYGTKKKIWVPDRDNRSEFLSENISQAMLNLYLHILILVIHWDKNMLKTLIDVKFPSFIFLFLGQFFVLDIFFRRSYDVQSAWQNVRFFFSRIFYGAPLPDWDEGFRGLLVEVVTVTLEVDSWLFCRFPFFFLFSI